MAGYGVEFYDSTGQLYLGGDYWATPIVDMIGPSQFATGSSSFTVSYPNLAGCILDYKIEPGRYNEYIVGDSVSQSTLSATFSYSLGYPVGTYTRSNTNYTSQVLVVMVSLGNTSQYGFQMFNAAGELSAGTVSPTYKYLGKYVMPKPYSYPTAWLNQYPSAEGLYAIEGKVVSGQAVWTHELTLAASLFPTHTRPVFLIDVPIYPNGVRAHMITPLYSGSTPTSGWIIRVAVYGTHTPTVYVFDRDSLTSPTTSSGYGMEVYDASGGLTFFTNQKMLTTLPRQPVTLTTPKLGTGTFATGESVTIPWISGTVPLITAATPRNMYAVERDSKSFCSLYGFASKFWSHDGTGLLRCDWRKPLNDPYSDTVGYGCAPENISPFQLEVSNGALYA